MKKITLLVASFLVMGNLAKASATAKVDEMTTRDFSYNEPISFVERGIEFFVFPNGEFDFNTRPNDSQGDYYYKSAGKRTDVAQNRMPQNYGVLIEQDSFGRIRRIGNTFINYDFRDRVTRIGSIFVQYNRYAVSQIGGLTLVYDRFGNFVDMYGEVCRKTGFTNNYYYNHNNSNTYYGSANGYYGNNNNSGYYYKNGRNANEKEEENK